MFRVEKVKNERKDDVVVSINNQSVTDNFYTLVTGENGCGKSTLLNKTINNFLFYRPGVDKECRIATLSELCPSRIIAICNARYNKFILKKNYLLRSKIHGPDYYIQADPTLEVGKSLNELIRLSLKETMNLEIKIVASPKKEIGGIRKAFAMIGVQPEIKFNLEVDEKIIEEIENIENIYSLERTDISKNNNHIIESVIRLPWPLRMEIESFINFYKNRDGDKIELGEGVLNFDSASYKISSNHINDGAIIAAIAVGIITPTKLKVQRNNSLKWVSHHNLSSGQQSLLLNAITISVFAKKNSLICIDEPENSLHPEWQLNYMKFLDYLLPSMLESHIFIATHSPQIVSGLQSDNGCIVSLINKNSMHRNNDMSAESSVEVLSKNWQELHSASLYKRKSAAQQLVDIFKSPGFDNEVIIHRLILILTKQTKRIKPNDDDEEFINGVQNLIRDDKIDSFDPVLVIYKQIKAFSHTGIQE